MRILLSGSTSFLGSKFIELYGQKHDIFGFSMHDPIHPIDILDKDKLEKAFQKFKPEAVIHLAAIVDHDAENSKEPNIRGTQNLVDLAQKASIPFIFMSSESVYGGKEETGEYIETDPYKSRSIYSETKVEGEKILKNSPLNFLILRGHRFVGINLNYNKPKQFPDTLKALHNNKVVHLDSEKLFKPTLIDHIADVFNHYLENHTKQRHIFNIGVEKPTTYYDFIVDVAKIRGLDTNLIKSDGIEAGWPQNSTLNVDKLRKFGYPSLSYKALLEELK